MNTTKTDVLFVLSQYSGKWLKPRKIAKELGLSTTAGINRVSNILYRLRNQPYIARRNKTHDYKYCYIEDKNEYPSNILTLSKSASDKKAINNSDKIDVFTFVELLPQATQGYCELCDKYDLVAFKAERNGSLIFLCEKHGKAIDKKLCGYGGAFL